MKTRLNPLEKLKAVFGRRPVAVRPEVGAVVYRKTRGDLKILLLRNKRGAWSVPAGRPLEEETDVEAVLRLVGDQAGPDELKVWQTLGQIGFEPKPGKRKPARLQLFLIQALSVSDQTDGSAVKEAAWLPVREAAEKIDHGELAGMVNLAAAKIKRAQI
ncbi:NUDIX domain-containing protein [Candidatus Saccharibacteria bacterium]|nr:NUDIX domain-containing protein [Candidatus Saccharibacteria bacterium]